MARSGDRENQVRFLCPVEFGLTIMHTFLRPLRERLLDRFLIEVLNEIDLTPYITGVTVPKLNQGKLKSIRIPLPPLEVQEEIVEEIEGYQKVIDGARAVVENYHPRITVDPEWPVVELGEVCSLGGVITKEVDLALPYLGADSIEANVGKLAGSIRQPISHYYGASTIFSSERTVRQFRMVLAVCSCAARYSFVSLLRATPLG